MMRDKMRTGTAPLIGLALLLMLSIPIGGVARQSNQKNPAQDPALFEKMQATQKSESAIPLGATVNPGSYLVGPSDVIGLNVWMSPPLQFRLDVTPEGSLIIPTVGEIAVSGLTLESVKEKVVAAVKKRYMAPEVTLTLLRPRPILVTIQGTVLHDGQYTLAATDRADRAIQFANIPRTDDEAGALASVERNMSRRHVVIRRLDGTRVKADIVRFLATGADADNPYLREGDVVIVPQKKHYSDQFAVYGELNAPGRFEHVEGDRILDALQMAQGFSDYANTDSVEVSRLSNDGNAMHSRHISVGRNPLFTADNFLIQPGDRIIVRKRNDIRADYRVYVEGEVLNPGTYPITKDKTKITDIISKAGGFTGFASLKSAELSRRSIDPQEIETDRLMSFRGGITADDSLDYLQETELRLKKEIVNVDFWRLFVAGDSTENVYLQSEDVIKIPAISRTIYVFGQIVTPGHIPFKEGGDPLYYVGKAGGFTDRARSDDLRIIKSRTKQWLAEDETTVEEGDYIWVPKEPDRPFSYYMTTASQAAGILSVIIGMAAVIISLSN